MKISPHRERYQLLIERRRALLELDRLTDRIDDHSAWRDACRADPELAAALELRRSDLDCELCTRACRAGSDELLCDVRRIYRGLVDLARVWVALEDGGSVRSAFEGDGGDSGDGGADRGGSAAGTDG